MGSYQLHYIFSINSNNLAIVLELLEEDEDLLEEEGEHLLEEGEHLEGDEDLEEGYLEGDEDLEEDEYDTESFALSIIFNMYSLSSKKEACILVISPLILGSSILFKSNLIKSYLFLIFLRIKIRLISFIPFFFNNIKYCVIFFLSNNI